MTTTAIYMETPISEYQGNPLIEALPPINTVRDTVKQLLKSPPLPDEESEVEISIKLHFLNRISKVLQPVTQHLELEQAISSLIRSGYEGRNPFSTFTIEHLHTIGHVNKPRFASTANSFCVFGLSGMGKTTAILSVLEMYPRTILHTEYKDRLFPQTQVVWIKVDCPFDGSVKSLCLSFLRAMSEALSDYDILKGTSHLGTSQLLIKMSQLANTYYLGVLVIDEIQTLNKARTGKQAVLDFVVNLINDFGIPVVMLGNNSALKLMTETLRNARRVCGSGMLSFERFTEQDPEWNRLIERLWKYQWTENKTALTPELRSKIYYLTQGIPDFLSKLLILTQRNLITEGRSAITAEVLEKVSNTRLLPLKPALTALRDGSTRSIECFEDLLPSDEIIQAMMFYKAASKHNLLEVLSACELDSTKNESPSVDSLSSHRKLNTKSDSPDIDFSNDILGDATDFSEKSAKKPKH